ncbi:MAG: superoxide dismutase [Pseudomonadota bacterium]
MTEFTYQLPPLPYPDHALAPVISANTLQFHYGKHHQGYCDKYNTLIKGTPMVDYPLERVIQETAKAADKTALFNNAAQIWNHTFYWKSLTAKGGGKPSGILKERIETSFGTFEKLREEWIDKSLNLFGSGWCWLVCDEGKVKIVQTRNAETPIVTGQRPLLTIDVWEHAYYLDFQNRRKDYAQAVIDKLINWEFAAENLVKR